MEYPGTHFTRSYRHLLLGLFIAAFGLIAPLVLFSTAGYRYNWQQGLLKETGSLSIDGKPENATVYLNNLKLTGGLPLRLKSLTPRPYTVRLAAPGFYDWQTEVKIKSKQTSYLKDISLIKKSEPRLVASGQIQTLSLSPAGRYLLYTRTRDKAAETRLYDIKREREVAIHNLPASPAVVRWAKKNSWLAISGAKLPSSQILLIDPNRALAFTVTPPANELIDQFQWTDQAEPELYYSTRNALWSYLPLSRKSVLATAKTFTHWRLDGATLWTLELSTSTGRVRIVKDALGFAEAIAQLDPTEVKSETSPAIFSAPELLGAAGDTAAIKFPNQRQIQIISPGKIFTVAAERWRLSAATGWWFFWHPHELTIYAPGNEPTLLQRSSATLKDVILLDDYHTVALQWEKDTTVFFPYYLVTHQFLSGSFTALAADTKTRTLFAAGVIKNQTGLWKLDY